MKGARGDGPFRGARKRRRYFEGWYFKQVAADRSEAWAFIPGLALGESPGEGYSFVQAIEGRTGRTWWFQYPLDAFRAATDRLEVRVGGSRFAEEGIVLDLAGEEGSFEGELRFGPFATLPRSPFWPGIMGPFAYAPFMECRHGLISLAHAVEGGFRADGRAVAIGGEGAPGRGYAEKDWGSSMPTSWIWAQTNNFGAAGDSFMISVARVPWLGAAFTGFLCAGRLGGRPLREASYTGARLADPRLEDGAIGLAILRGGDRLELRVARPRGGLLQAPAAGVLRAPVRGLLSRRISESMDAGLRLRWTRDGALLFEGEAPGAGLEVAGDPRSLFERRGRSP